MTARSPAKETQTDKAADPVASELQSIYSKLAQSFDVTFHDVRGGVNLTYITGEQVVRRLNEVLGFTGWSFSVLSHGINTEADEAWVLGELIVYSHATEAALVALVPTESRPNLVLVRRQQFGSQKLKRKRTDKQILDIGFDFKGAATDALKKCASQIGVGLYLMARSGGTPVEMHEQAEDVDEDLVCTEEGCGEDIRGKRFASGEVWSVMDVVQRGKAINDDKPLCFKHLKSRLQPGPAPKSNGTK